MLLRKKEITVDINDLDIIEMFNYTHLCIQADKGEIQYLIYLFNNDPNSLNMGELYFIIDRVLPGQHPLVKKDEYELYISDTREELILSKADIAAGTYTGEYIVIPTFAEKVQEQHSSHFGHRHNWVDSFAEKVRNISKIKH